MGQKLCHDAWGPLACAVAWRMKEENRQLVWPLLLRGCTGTGGGFLDPSPSPPRPLPKVLHACVLQDKLLLCSSHKEVEGRVTTIKRSGSPSSSRVEKRGLRSPWKKRGRSGCPPAAPPTILHTNTFAQWSPELPLRLASWPTR